MRKSVILILSSLLVVQPNGARADIFEKYIKQVKSVLANCTISYSMNCSYPDGNKVNVNGIMAVKGNNYYDSSNTRHVLLNDSWLFFADHMEKQVSIANVAGINKRLKNAGTFSATEYLLGSDADEIYMKLLKQTDDTVWIGLSSKDKVLESMELVVLRNTYTPIRYTAVINYPLYEAYEKEDGTTVPGIIRLNINCYKIESPADDKYFDHNKLLTKSSNKIVLKKYKNYTAIY